jgi:hypothetical protein
LVGLADSNCPNAAAHCPSALGDKRKSDRRNRHRTGATFPFDSGNCRVLQTFADWTKLEGWGIGIMQITMVLPQAISLLQTCSPRGSIPSAGACTSPWLPTWSGPDSTALKYQSQSFNKIYFFQAEINISSTGFHEM